MAENKQINELDERKMRLKRLENIKNSGINPYPEKFDKLHSLAEAKNSKEGTKIKTAGRIMTIRNMGKIAFAHLQDWSGKMQVVLKEDEIGKDKFKFFNDNFDMGDFIGVEGEIFKTQKGEVSVLVKKYEFLGKALLPLPEKFHGIKDTDTIYRQRYLDLIMNEESKKRFEFRSDFIRLVRQFYWENNFIEVETPTLLHQATGATATPYKTHNNALDIDLYLRISHELPLKELIVGGMEKIFEIGKAFRNEGVDPSHLPEHTHLEHYSAYWNFEDNIQFTEKMFDYIFEKMQMDKKLEIENREGEKKVVDFKTPWKRVDFIEMLKKDTGIDVEKYDEANQLLKDIKKKKIEFEGMDDMSLVGLVDNLYKKVSRPKIVGPMILFNYPKYLQPLARINDKDSNIVDQFQMVVNGWEIVKAYSELVDPIDQKERFNEQNRAKAKGEAEVMESDDEFITALEHGAPPISGLGMGIDRLVALLTQQSNLRDVVLFPLLRPEGEAKKIKETKIATVVLNKELNLQPWQEMNTIAHLSASFASRKGKELLYADSTETKDGEKLLLNIQHAIMIKEAHKNNEIFDLIKKARSEGLDVYEFTQEMQSTTNDKKVLIETKEKNLKDIKILGILIFGEKQLVDEMTKNYKLYNGSTNIKIPDDDGDLGINYDQAKKLLDRYIKDPIVKLHCIESEYIMRDLAKHFKQDEEKWGIIGLLHDIDWDLTKDDPSQHCIKAQEILKDAGASGFLIETIVSHCYGYPFNSELKDLRRQTRIQFSLAASETLTGLIISSALIQPDKKLASLSVESLKKKFKNLKFAANCNREMISECEQAGISLDEFLELGLKALQKIADRLGM
ncbi:MAG: lysine--tRNA ligase [Candidatus Buchananbacteria bacterium]